MSLSNSKSCFSLVEGDNIQVISFWNTIEDLKRIVADLCRGDCRVQQVHFRYIRVCDDDNDKFLAPIIKAIIQSHSTIIIPTKLRFDHSSIENLLLVTMVFAAAADHHHPFALEFHQCFIYRQAAEWLQLLLISGVIHELTLDQCIFDNDNNNPQSGGSVGGSATAIIAKGLEQNQSLRSLTYCCGQWSHQQELSLIFKAVTVMLASNSHVECLALDLRSENDIDGSSDHHAMFQPLFKPTGPCLQRLHLRGCVISLTTMESIMNLLCLTQKSLTELDFGSCVFRYDSMALLVEAISEFPVTCSLDLSDVRIHHGTVKVGMPRDTILELSNSRVKRLILSCQLDFPRSLIQNFATIGLVQHLYLIDSGHYTFKDVCDWLRNEQSPFELIMETTIPPHRPTDIYDPNKNMGLKTITWCAEENTEILADLAQQLNNMPGLRRLVLRQCDDFETAEFIMALAKSLEQNRSLCTVALHGLAPATTTAVREHLASIRCALALNRVGHFRLMECDPPVMVSLWAMVLARSSQDPDGMYFVLREMPDILSAR